MTYNLSIDKNQKEKHNKPLKALKKFLLILADEKKSLVTALITILVHSVLTLLAPLIIGYTIDRYIQNRQYQGVLFYSGILLGIYMVSLVTSYLQTKLMGSVGQRVLFKLRNSIFFKFINNP